MDAKERKANVKLAKQIAQKKARAARLRAKAAKLKLRASRLEHKVNMLKNKVREHEEMALKLDLDS